MALTKLEGNSKFVANKEFITNKTMSLKTTTFYSKKKNGYAENNFKT